MPEKPILKKQKCGVCGHSWWSRSKAEHPTCPNCGNKVGYKTRRTGKIRGGDVKKKKIKRKVQSA